MRLTNKSDLLGYTRKFNDTDIIRKMTKKLGQLEDIEDDLGIELVTLFKALKDGAYFKNPYYKNQINYFNNLKHNWDMQKKCFDIRMECFVKPYHYSSGGAFFYFKDYGKTWALTREELE